MREHKVSIIILPETISKNGFRYILLSRAPNKAFYKQTLDNVQVGFEVFLIRIRGTHFSPFLNQSVRAAERFPGNEDFGRTAWTFTEYQKAVEKYNEL